MPQDKTTCATCKHMGTVYHRGWRDHYSCGMEPQRRRDTMRPTGDFAQDFMDNFRTFFDAAPDYASCGYYEVGQPLSESDAALLAHFTQSGRAVFGFWSDEAALAYRAQGRLTKREQHAKCERGEVVFVLTDLAKYLLRTQAAPATTT